MKEIIKQKLNQMEDLQEKQMLKKILSSFFDELISHQELTNNKIEKRIFEGLEDFEKNYDIYCTLVNKNEIDPLDESMKAIDEIDNYKDYYDGNKAKEYIFYNKEIRIYKVFLEMDYLSLKKLIKSERIFSGKLKTKDNEYEVKFKLVENEEYFELAENIYKIFNDNLISWRTFNIPYLRKFFDVIAVEYCDEIKKLRKECKCFEEMPDIIEMNFNLEEFEEYKKMEMAILWNINISEQKSDGFPMPTEDKVNFEHVITMKKMNKKHGYLVKGGDVNVLGVKREGNDLIIITDRNKSLFWDVLKVIQDDEIKIQRNEFPVFTNARKKTFLNKFVQRQSNVVRTFSEISRIINSFENSTDFIIENIEIKENDKQEYHTYDLNEFIKDEIRETHGKKMMLISFTCKAFTYMTYDILSFIVSEVQIYFPEYQCKGVII